MLVLRTGIFRLEVFGNGRPQNEFRVTASVYISCGGVVVVSETRIASGPVNGLQRLAG
jgi:hypothetical protein